MDEKSILALLGRLRVENNDFFTGQRQMTLDLDYDEQGDVMYIAFDAPRPAVSVSIDSGMIVRYNPTTFQIVGFTITSFKGYFLARFPEFCFLLHEQAPKSPVSDARPANVAALSRTTSTLFTAYMAT